MRTKNVVKNFATDFLPQILIMLIGIFKAKILLNYLGESVLGLYQLFMQIVPYLALAEGGLSTASLYRLYGPIAKKDYKKEKEVLNATTNVFIVVGCIMLACGLGISFLIPHFINNNPFEFTYIQFNFMLYLLSEVMIYFTISSRIVFEANQKKYKINLIIQSAAILKSLLEIVILVLGGTLTNMFTMFVFVSVITNLIIIYKAKKEYAYLPKVKEKDYSLVKDIKDLFVHKIGGLIANNIDIIIISSTKGLGLAKVVVYSSYNYIVNSMKIVIDKLYGAASSSVGNLLFEDSKKSHDIFLEYNAIVNYIAIVLGIPLFFAVDYFIDIWYEGKVLTSIAISIMFILVFMYNTIRVPLLNFTTASGLFKETKICPILESIINLTLSLIFVRKFGIPGVLIATLISLICSEYLIKPVILYKKVFKRNVMYYYIKNLKFVAYIIFAIIVISVIKLNLVINNLLVWFILSGIIFIANLLIASIYFSMVKENKFFERFKMIFLNKVKLNKGR